MENLSLTAHTVYVTDAKQATRVVARVHSSSSSLPRFLLPILNAQEN